MVEDRIEYLLVDSYIMSHKQQNFREILTSGLPIRSAFLKRSDLIADMFPEFAPSIGFEQNSKYHCHDVYEHSLCVVDNCKSNKFEIKLAALFHDIGKPKAAFVGADGYTHFHGHPQYSYEICAEMLPRVLEIKGDELSRVLSLIREHDKPLQSDKKIIRRFIREHGQDFFEDWLVLKQADIDDHINLAIGENCPDIEKIKQLYKEILEEDERFKLSDLAVNGYDLMEIGIPQGKEIGEVLNMLYESVKEDRLSNTKQELIDAVLRIRKIEKEFIRESMTHCL